MNNLGSKITNTDTNAFYVIDQNIIYSTINLVKKNTMNAVRLEADVCRTQIYWGFRTQIYREAV
jgi:hypothetical protein